MSVWFVRLFLTTIHDCIFRPSWKKISPEAKDLLSCMLRTDPTHRLSASECLLHPWITGRAHTNEHLVHLVDVQVAMKARLDRKAKKAAEHKK